MKITMICDTSPRDFDSEPAAKIAGFDLVRSPRSETLNRRCSVCPSRHALSFLEQDGTLVYTKSGGPFAKNADDWKFFSKKVPEVLKKFHNDGYRIVIFRYLF